MEWVHSDRTGGGMVGGAGHEGRRLRRPRRHHYRHYRRPPGWLALRRAGNLAWRRTDREPDRGLPWSLHPDLVVADDQASLKAWGRCRRLLHTASVRLRRHRLQLRREISCRPWRGSWMVGTHRFPGLTPPGYFMTPLRGSSGGVDSRSDRLGSGRPEIAALFEVTPVVVGG